MIWAHHFAKGSASDKDPIDRVSGSGVWGRDPDAIISYTPHQEDDCMAVDTVLRNFKSVDTFAIRWEYPLWCRATDLDPTALKGKHKGGRPQGNSSFEIEDLKDVLDHLGEATINRQNAESIAKKAGVSMATVWRRWKTYKEIQQA